MGELKKLELFAGVIWPSYQSVINHVTHKVSGLLAKHAHLFTAGKEQAEPAEGETEGTKNEEPLGEFENLIIDVAEIRDEAKKLMADATDAKDKEVEKTRKREASMQDESTKTQYEGLNPGELKGSRSQRKEARERRERRQK